jgi:hypothetical protein
LGPEPHQIFTNSRLRNTLIATYQRVKIKKGCAYKRIFHSSVADPGSGAFLPQVSGMIFFRIPDPYHVPNSIYLQDFTFINGEKQEKLNFFLKYDFNFDLFLHEKKLI